MGNNVSIKTGMQKQTAVLCLTTVLISTPVCIRFQEAAGFASAVGEGAVLGLIS